MQKLIVFVCFCLGSGILGGIVPSYDLDDDEGFILGGNDTDISDVPYQAALCENPNYSYCGGVIIAKKYVLTAAHCINKKQADKLFVRVGSSYENKGGQFVGAEELFVHENYNSRLVDYDVGVIKLQQPLEYSEKVQPISLLESEPKPGSLGKISGWGLTAEDGLPPKSLQSVTVPVVDKEFCKKALKHMTLTDRMFCAGGKVNEDSCSGDSGGPMAIEGKLAGLVSFGWGCGNRDTPGVYTNLAHPKIDQFVRKFIPVAEN